MMSENIILKTVLIIYMLSLFYKLLNLLYLNWKIQTKLLILTPSKQTGGQAKTQSEFVLRNKRLEKRKYHLQRPVKKQTGSRQVRQEKKPLSAGPELHPIIQVLSVQAR